MSGTNFNQGMFDFDSDGDDFGYRKWREELDEQKKKFESRYGIVIGSMVRLTLKGEDQVFEGMITLSDLNPPKDRSQLRLRIGSRQFGWIEIESIMRL